MDPLFGKISKKQCADFGQVAVLATLFLVLYERTFQLASLAFWLLLLTLMIPVIFYPFAWIWFGLAAILSRISSWLILNLIFFLIVIPVGTIRKFMGRDPLKIKQFRKNRDSVMIDRNHIYRRSDLDHTF